MLLCLCLYYSWKPVRLLLENPCRVLGDTIVDGTRSFIYILTSTNLLAICSYLQSTILLLVTRMHLHIPVNLKDHSILKTWF